jgi:hypothetical protein
MLARTSE